MTDSRKYPVQKLSRNLEPLAIFKLQGPQLPLGIATDADGNLYVGSTGPELYKLSSSGQPLAKWVTRRPDETSRPISGTYSVALDAQGRVYGAAAGWASLPQERAPQILRFSAEGQVEAAWGEDELGPGQFRYPTGLAVDGQGNIYVADRPTHRVTKLSPTGEILGQWGRYGTGPGEFATPSRLALDVQGNIYVADAMNHRIQKLSPDGGFLAAWGTPGSGPGQLNKPTGIAVDRYGNLYVAEEGNQRVQKLSPAWEPLAQWGSGPTTLASPAGMTVDSLGDIYVTDQGRDRIQKLSPAGQPLLHWGTAGSAAGQFNFPMGLATDAQNNVYVVDSRNHRIQKFSPAGQFLGQWGGRGDAPGEFNFPSYVRVDAAGDIYVADTSNHRIQKLSPGGVPLLQWGGQGNAPGQLNGPSRFTLDGEGNLYVADARRTPGGVNQAARIQKFSPTGQLLRVWTISTSTDSAPNAHFTSVAVDRSGTVHAVLSGEILILTQDLEPIGRWRESPEGRLESPRELEIDSHGDLYGLNRGSALVLKFVPASQ